MYFCSYLPEEGYVWPKHVGGHFLKKITFIHPSASVGILTSFMSFKLVNLKYGFCLIQSSFPAQIWIIGNCFSIKLCYLNNSLHIRISFGHMRMQLSCWAPNLVKAKMMCSKSLCALLAAVVVLFRTLQSAAMSVIYYYILNLLFHKVGKSE